MNEDKWTESRKLLCDKLWDSCAQVECESPCSRIIEAEKQKQKEQYFEWQQFNMKLPTMKCCKKGEDSEFLEKIIGKKTKI